MYRGDVLGSRDRVLILLPVVVLNLLPPFIGALSHPGRLPEFVVFVAVAFACALAFIYSLSRFDSEWIKFPLLVLGCAATAWYIFLFTPIFANAYTAGEVLVLSIFLLFGLRYGLMVLGVSMVSTVYYLWNDPTIRNDLAYSLNILAIQATVGILAWIVISKANNMRDRAEQSTAEAREAQARSDTLAAEATEAKDDARKLAGEVTRLNRLIIISQDNERRIVARDIHDGPLQSLGVELLAVDRARHALEAEDYERVETELSFLREIARDSVEDLRSTMNNLRNTLLDSGIELALEGLVRKTKESTGLKIDLSVSLHHELPAGFQNCLYQLAMEALNNVKKHAQAKNVSIILCQSSQGVTLGIEDDGCGFEYNQSLQKALSAGHIGMHSVRERAGEFHGVMDVATAPGFGSRVTFTFPQAIHQTTSRQKIPLLTKSLN